MKAGLDNWIDIVVLAIYFVLVLVVGLLVSIAKYSTMYNSKLKHSLIQIVLQQ